LFYRCYKLNCSDHLIQHPLPRVRIDPVPPFLCPVSKILLPTDFVRLNRRVPNVKDSRILFDDIQGCFKNVTQYSEEFREEGNTEKKQLEFIDKLSYDSNSKRILFQSSPLNNRSKNGSSNQQLIPVANHCDLYEWLSQEQKDAPSTSPNFDRRISSMKNKRSSSAVALPDFQDNPLTSLLSTSVVENPKKKRAYEEQLDLSNFQPIYQKKLKIQNPFLSNLAPHHPIIINNLAHFHNRFGDDLMAPISKKSNLIEIVLPGTSSSSVPSTAKNITSNADAQEDDGDEIIIEDDEDEDEEIAFEFTKKQPVSTSSLKVKTNPTSSQSAQQQQSILSTPSHHHHSDSKKLKKELLLRRLEFQQSFNPMLSDAEIALICKLISMYKSFHEYKHDFTKSFEDVFREITANPTTVTSVIGSVPFNMLINEENKGEKVKLIFFLCCILQTRSIEEMIKILQAKDWLLLDQMSHNGHAQNQNKLSPALEQILKQQQQEQKDLLYAMELSEKFNLEEQNEADSNENDDDNDEEVNFAVLNTNKINTIHTSYQACSHSGPCNNENQDCVCMRNKTWCEKYCCCDRSCKRKFFGCNCKNGQCRTKSCPCYAASRACDPDLCGSCGVSIPPFYVNQLQDYFQRIESSEYCLPVGGGIKAVKSEPLISKSSFPSKKGTPRPQQRGNKKNEGKVSLNSVVSSPASVQSVEMKRSVNNESPNDFSARIFDLRERTTEFIDPDKTRRKRKFQEENEMIQEQENEDEEQTEDYSLFYEANENEDQVQREQGNKPNQKKSKVSPEKANYFNQFQNVVIPVFKFCSNLPFHLRKPKKVNVKPSKIHGWGTFTQENIEKNEFVMEYKGELISQEEADRRGIIYDKLNLSYLFNINNDVVVDATRKGNKAKYLNHNEKDPNCGTRIVFVNGDHKVGIFALRNIEKGEELTFDYGYKSNAPKWAGGGKNSASSKSNKYSTKKST
jgi:hypothetical protein